MIKYICSCGYIYNPEYGDLHADIDPGVKFSELPEVWVCPFCGLPKTAFEEKDKRTQSEFESLK